jgi:hypothetical protein
MRHPPSISGRMSLFKFHRDFSLQYTQADQNNSTQEFDSSSPPDESVKICEPRLWADRGWTARVIKNEDDEGWAVAMIKDGESEPALVGPWTMGRDKKNPKPLDVNAFHTLVKTASEVIRRHEQQLHASLHKTLSLCTDHTDYLIRLDIVPDEYDPYAYLSAEDQSGNIIAKVKVAANFQLNRKSATKWIENEFRQPR